jgi:HlyD family secretion protein
VKKKSIFILSLVGLLIAVFSAYLFNLPRKVQPPVFNPSANPYEAGIYATGIIESAQPNGANINLYFEVPGTLAQIFVNEGQVVTRGTRLAVLDDSVQRALLEQQKEQAEAALTLLKELKAEPRPETLAVSKAQLELAEANVTLMQTQYDKQRISQELRPGSVSRDALDNARNNLKVAVANAKQAARQYELTKAGAWSYDIANQERQYKALQKAAASSAALLGKYTLRAPTDGLILAIDASIGSYVSSSGTYDTYTQTDQPIMIMGSPPGSLDVRCYIDEILVHRLPRLDTIRAEMAIRGTNVRVPLEFVRVQPYVSPKIQLSDQRQERVDVRVLPVIFRFARKPDFNLYPGQQVDVYISQ